MKKFLVALLLGSLSILQLTRAETKAAAPAASADVSQVAREEIIRREEAQIMAQQLMNQGQKLYFEGKYEEAIAKLEQAIKVLPRAPATEIDYNRAAHGLTDSYYHLADTAYRAGDSAKAKDLAQKALQYDPRNRSAENLIVKIKVDEKHKQELAARPPSPPETPAPDKTPEFVAKKDQLRKLFREGKILLNSGQLDEAERRFQQVLLIDPYNDDAHVLLGEVNRQRLDSAQVGADLARSHALWEVTDAWIPPISREVQVPKAGERTSVIAAGAARSAEIIQKLNSIIIPEINLRDAVITDVVRFLSDESRRLDPQHVGVNIVLQLGEGAAAGAPAAPPPAPTPAAGAEGQPAEAALGGAETGRRITLSLRDIPLVEALKYVTSVAGLKYRVEPNAVLVLPKDAPEGEMITRSYPVQSGAIKQVITTPAGAAAPTKRTTSEEFVAMGGSQATVGPGDVKQFFIDAGVQFPAGSSLAYNERTSTIIVRNTPENLETFERVLATLNVVPSQVEIEAKFVEISQNDLDELGFQWKVGQKSFGSFGAEGGGPNTAFLPPAPSGSPSDDITPGLRDSSVIQGNAIETLLASQGFGTTGASTADQIATLRGILTNPQFELVIKALSQKKSSDVLSAPKVTTISGSSAQIKVVQEFIYPTEYDPAQVVAAGGGVTGGGAAAVSPSTPTSFKTREVGVLLNVTPTVGADGYTINLTLIPEVSEFQGFIEYGSPIVVASGGSSGSTSNGTSSSGFTSSLNSIKQPLFSTRSLTTSIVIWDGQTVVLGGLIREETQKIDDKVPFLGDIPFVGRLFRSKTSVRSKRNLLIFVTARLIDPAGNPIHRQETVSLR